MSTVPSKRPDDLLPGLAEIVHLVTGRDAAEVRQEFLFVEDLRIDSLAMVEILEGTAKHFSVRIDDEDAKAFVRVGDLTTYVAERLG